MIKGIYIHIPFCNIKCPYCDFTSFVWQEDKLKDRYVEALKKELLMYLDNDFDIQTIYFGGGTPSTLKPEKIAEIIEFIKNNVKYQKNLEITVEINPKTYEYQEFKIIKDAGVNRISIGNQSFLEKNLAMLGRDHKPEDSYKTIENCIKAGISNINLDLIYGIQNQTLQDLEKDLEIYTSLPITHISAYILTAYEDTPLGTLVEKGLYHLPDEDLVYQMFLMIDQALHNKGFERYELSNWAKKGYECKHNLFYWTDVNFLGIGVSAWSYVDNERFGNTKNINEYLENVEKGIKPVKLSEILDEKKKLEEKIFLGLRLKEGVDVDLIKNKDFLKELVDEGYGDIKDGRFYLLAKGIMVINEIVRKVLSVL
jgi:oxygen-independent coproporphyrinogen-3 oxidase